MTHLISTNNYALLVCGLLVITISMSLILVGCYCKRNRATPSRSGHSLLGGKKNGFHRYDEEDEDEDQMNSIRKNMSDGNNRISLNMNTSSIRYSKLEETDSKKLLVDSDDDEDNEEKVFAR